MRRVLHAFALLTLAAAARSQDEPNFGGALDLASLDPAVAFERMQVAAGYDVNLFASEADFPIGNPMAMTFDARGRLWVLTMPSYPHAVPGEAPTDKLVILEDRDGDGRADHHTVFADDLYVPTGFELGHGGAYVAQQPNLVFLRDTDGDDVADERETVLHGFGTEDSHHSISAFTWGPGGALYFQEGTFHHTQVETPWGPVRCLNGGTFRYEPRRHFLEVFVSYPYLNPWGHTFDRWGQDFLSDASDGSNYFALPLSGHLAYPGKHPRVDSFTERVRPTGGSEFVSSRHFPDDAQGQFLITNVIGFRGILRHRMHDDGSGFRGEKVGPLLWSDDPNFRPVGQQFGPDGALYVVDWFNPLIGHMQFSIRDPRRDHGHGRVWRVTAAGRPLLDAPEIAGRGVAELLELLRTPEDRVRYRVRRELGERDPDDVARAIDDWVVGLDRTSPEFDALRLEALWVRQTVGVCAPELLAAVLESADPRARAAAVRVARGWRHALARPLEPLARAVRDPHPRVRLEGLVALSHLGTAAAARAALAALDRPGDEFLDYALEETTRALAPAWKVALRDDGSYLADDPAALEYLLHRLESDELEALAPTVARFREQLARMGADVDAALEGLARLRGTSELDELLEAIERVDASDDAHADHVLAGLFRRLQQGSGPISSRTFERLASLAANSGRPATKRQVTAAALAAGLAQPAPGDGQPWSRIERIEAIPLVVDPEVRSNLAGFLWETILQRPAEADTTERRPTRFVRVSLPGPRRTLTLAEVEVFEGGANVAPLGVATQSSTNWGGTPERAVDGIRSGTWADGGQTHTLEDQANPWWELDLGQDRVVETVTIWNRTDADFARRLDDLELTLLDAGRNVVASFPGGRAETRMDFEMLPPAEYARRKAIQAVGALGVNQEWSASMLSSLLDDESVALDALEALGSIPVELWREGVVEATATRILAWAERPPAWMNAADSSRAVRALGGELATRLDADRASELRRALRSLGPVAIVIRPIRDEMLYDQDEIRVEAGRAVELTFENTDIMPHNLLVTAPGKLSVVGLAAEALARTSEGYARGFVPDVPEVLWGTRLLQPGEEQTLRFVAPEVGDHPFVCTFPGHWVRMNGVMHVVASLDDEPAEAPAAAVPANASPARGFVRDWSVDDLRPFLGELDHGRSFERGRAAFEQAACVSCHRIDGAPEGDAGGDTGPDLGDVAQRYSREELLRQVLEPSAQVAEEYRAEIFITLDGLVHSGLVVEEDVARVLLQDDPYDRDATVEIFLEDVEERIVSEVSPMPTGLLSTFSRHEILDLLAYLAARGRAESPVYER